MNSFRFPSTRLSWHSFIPLVAHSSGRKFGWGVCIPVQLTYAYPWLAEAELALLDPSCYLNYGPAPRATRDGCKFYPMVYNDQWWSRPESAARMSSSTDTWLFLNEPERPDQANHTPAQGVALYNELCAQRNALSPDSAVAAPGISVRMPDYDGLAWLARFMAEVPVPEWPAFFHVHLYRQGSLDDFNSSWRAWKSWQQANAPGVPVILSETCAENAPVAVQKQVMYQARSLLEAEVSAVFWFHTHRQPSPPTWPNPALCSVNAAAKTVSLTELGSYWMSLRS